MNILVDDKIETLETSTPKRVEQIGNSYYNLFPTPVSMNQIGRDFTKKELDFVRKQERRPYMGKLS